MDDHDAAPPARRWPRALGWLASAALLAVAVFVLRDRMGAVGDAGGLPGLIPVMVAVVANFAANGVLVAAWREILRVAGTALAFRSAAWVWSTSQLARYTVGAAQVAGRAIAGRRFGVTATSGATTTLVEVGWATSLDAALLLATLPFWLPGAEDLTWLAWAAAVPAAVLLVGLVAPRTLLIALGRVLSAGPVAKLTGGRLDDVAGRVRLGRGEAARLTGLYVGNLVLRIGGYLALFAGLGGDLAADGLLAIGGYAAGQVIGRLAVFAPGGLGPREGANALIVAGAIGGGPALALVAATRLVEVVAELAFFGVTRGARPDAARAAG